MVSVGQDIDTMIGARQRGLEGLFGRVLWWTHLSNAEQADILIVSEEPVSKGVRRINAVTGTYAKNVLEESEEITPAATCAKMEPAEKLKECKLLQTLSSPRPSMSRGRRS